MSCLLSGPAQLRACVSRGRHSCQCEACRASLITNIAGEAMISLLPARALGLFYDCEHALLDPVWDDGERGRDVFRLLNPLNEARRDKTVSTCSKTELLDVETCDVVLYRRILGGQLGGKVLERVKVLSLRR